MSRSAVENNPVEMASALAPRYCTATGPSWATKPGNSPSNRVRLSVWNPLGAGGVRLRAASAWS